MGFAGRDAKGLHVTRPRHHPDLERSLRPEEAFLFQRGRNRSKRRAFLATDGRSRASKRRASKQIADGLESGYQRLRQIGDLAFRHTGDEHVALSPT